MRKNSYSVSFQFVKRKTARGEEFDNLDCSRAKVVAPGKRLIANQLHRALMAGIDDQRCWFEFRMARMLRENNECRSVSVNWAARAAWGNLFYFHRQRVYKGEPSPTLFLDREIGDFGMPLIRDRLWSRLSQPCVSLQDIVRTPQTVLWR